MICPECGKPLTKVKPPASKLWAYVPWLVLLVVAGAGIWFGMPYASTLLAKIQHSNIIVADGESTDSTGATPGPANAGSTSAGTGATPADAQPPATVQHPDHIDTDLNSAANKRARDEVLKRIDLMPTVSESNKDKLYNSVERARTMGLVLIIPFAAGKVAIDPNALQALKTELDRPELQKLRADPAAVFVILGYADPKGDEKKNLDISQRRADSVLEAMRDKCGIANVMHSVAMGGQKLIDAKNLEKNRVVEIWVVQP